MPIRHERQPQSGPCIELFTPTAFTTLPWLAASAMVRTTFPSTSLQHNCYRRVSNALKHFFSAQVLDHFRLCNLELKASAYQFYQLICRLTTPMAPGEVLDLYQEFRRMARIWRWMKKLKWAGYAGGPNKVKDVGAGELAIFCPACPQPGINIPDNWREDHARHVEDFYLYLF